MLGDPLFDAYLMVDWSGASKPKRGADSIWIALLIGEDLVFHNPATREEASRLCKAGILDCLDRGMSMLAGFDFSFAFPAGTARRLGVVGWQGVWQMLAEEVEDDSSNGNRRFELAAEWNRRLTGGPSPFWGCPPAHVCELLSPTRPSRTELPALRLCEQRARARSTWQLYYSGSVGSQALLGIPRLQWLRDQDGLRDALDVWPLSTGFRAPAGRGRVTLAEVYPSLFPLRGRIEEIKDAAQVRTLAQHFRALDMRGELAACLEPPPGLTHDQLRTVTTEEGWILGLR